MACGLMFPLYQKFLISPIPVYSPLNSPVHTSQTSKTVTCEDVKEKLIRAFMILSSATVGLEPNNDRVDLAVAYGSIPIFFQPQ